MTTEVKNKMSCFFNCYELTVKNLNVMPLCLHFIEKDDVTEYS